MSTVQLGYMLALRASMAANERRVVKAASKNDLKRTHHSFHSHGFFLESASYCNGVRLTSITGEGRGLIYWPQSRIGSEEHLR